MQARVLGTRARGGAVARRTEERGEVVSDAGFEGRDAGCEDGDVELDGGPVEG